MEVNPRLVSSSIAEEPKQLLKAIKGYEKKPLLSLKKACEPLHEILDELPQNIHTALQNSQKPADGLTPDESASIHLYTMEWYEPKNSLYARLNRALRTPERQVLRPWFPYLKLLLTALFKLPSFEGNLWRGVREDSKNVYTIGETKVWWAFSSCTNSLETLKQPQFVGASGTRTLFRIEGTSTGRDISHHSFFKAEAEILLLPGTNLVVQSFSGRADGLYIVHLREVKPPYELLVSPFNEEEVPSHLSRHRQTVVPSRSNLTRSLPSVQYDSKDDDDDDDSSADEAPNFRAIRNVTQDKNNRGKTPAEGPTSSRTSKFQTQKSAREHIEINYVDRMGNYVIVQNTSASNRDDQDMTGWSIKKTIETNNQSKVLLYEFPDRFILKPRVPVRILARNISKNSMATSSNGGMTSLIADSIATWGTGTLMITQLLDDQRHEQATYTQKFI